MSRIENVQNPVIVRLQGGLGNQLYQYAIGRSLSILHGRRLLLDPRLIQAEAPARHYDLGALRIVENHVSGLNKWCVRWACSVRLGSAFRTACPLVWKYRIVQDRECGYDPTVFDDHAGPLILQGYWQSFRYFSDYRTTLLQEFAPRNPIESHTRNLIAEFESQEAVAVHIRRGDYVTNPVASSIHGTCNLNYYTNAAHLIAERISNPRFYVFTDDPAWARSNLSLPGSTRVIDENLGHRDFEDLWAMSRCRHFIIANSSFSWWGAWLSDSPQKIVIAPAKWFNIDNCPVGDRIPSDWIRL